MPLQTFQTPTASLSRPWAAVLASAGIVVAAIHSLSWYGDKGTLLLSPYWLSFYIATYQDGFRRRALIGSICRMLAPHGISVFVINAIAVATAVLLLMLLVKAFSRSAELDSPKSRLFGFAFFASIFGGMVFETLGDTLQIAFLLFLGALLLTIRAGMGPTARLVVGLALIAIAFFIHEASLFFVVPLLPFLIRHRPRIVDFALPLTAFVVLFGLSMKWSHLNPVMTYKPILYPASLPMYQPVETPDFKTLLHIEYVSDFGSVKAMLRFATTCLRLAAVLGAGIFALAQCLPLRKLNGFLLRLGTVLLFNLPMWVVAHDWGRFVVYGFLLSLVAVVATGNGSEEDAVEMISPRSYEAIRNMYKTPSGQALAGAVLVLLFCSQTEFSRITGIDEKVFAMVSLLLLLSVVLRSRQAKVA